MAPAEIAARARKKSLEIIDARANRDWTSVSLKAGRSYPQLPSPTSAPGSLRDALRRDVEEILSGRWRAFGHIPIRVSDPPQWHKDYLAGADLPTNQSGFKLNHRDLPHGADIKVIWELSRWHSLTRLALAAYVLGDQRAAWKCVHWLEHWAQHNPPWRGWNWTSALEAGIRLVQFTWIEALLQRFVGAGEGEAELEQLRYEILPAHVWFTWRHKSFGSSANNHLLGELAGLIVAIARWPELSAWAASLDELQKLWEREVLAQFAEDGGNREQALHYHLFSFELCWHTRLALQAVGRTISPAVEHRLELAADFYVTVQAPADQWDYGDSDSAFVLPLAADTSQTIREWLEWIQKSSGALEWLIGASPKRARAAEGWRVFRESGMAINRTSRCFLRWDLSPLGYLSTAAHGHLDALHLSLWLGNTAMIIDPGTGAYYGDRELRYWLASRGAHNGPCPAVEEWPRRLGPFLWSDHHAKPTVEDGKRKVTAELSTPTGILRRSIAVSESGEIVVEDSMQPIAGVTSFTVLWQFAPETKCQEIESRRFRLTRHAAGLDIVVSPDWTVDLSSVPPGPPRVVGSGTVSPHFRVTTWAPYLKLRGETGAKPCLFTTTFLASPVP
jgi:hypothetical protein